MRYRKKPIVIDAIQFKSENNKGNHQEIADFVGQQLKIINMGDTIIIPTLEGNMQCSLNDYVIRGIKGEYYPIKEDIFIETYEKI